MKKYLLCLFLFACATVKSTGTGREIYLCPTAADVLERMIGHQAITLPGVSILPNNADPALVCHENKHREQSIREGQMWLPNYLHEHLLHGYEGNSYEIEAREACAYLGPS